jgi:hypothetical protein
MSKFFEWFNKIILGKGLMPIDDKFIFRYIELPTRILTTLDDHIDGPATHIDDLLREKCIEFEIFDDYKIGMIIQYDDTLYQLFEQCRRLIRERPESNVCDKCKTVLSPTTMRPYEIPHISIATNFGLKRFDDCYALEINDFEESSVFQVILSFDHNYGCIQSFEIGARYTRDESVSALEMYVTKK